MSKSTPNNAARAATDHQAPAAPGSPFVSPPGPADLSARIAAGRALPVAQRGMFSVAVPGRPGVHLWAIADLPTIRPGTFAVDTFWSGRNTPCVLRLVSAGGYAAPDDSDGSLVYLVRQGHEESDFAALDAHIARVGWYTRPTVVPLFGPLDTARVIGALVARLPEMPGASSGKKGMRR